MCSTKRKCLISLEARVGFEPTNGGFADLSLRPLGYRAEAKKYSEIAGHLSVAAPSSKVVDLAILAREFRTLGEVSFSATPRAQAALRE